MAVVTGWGSLRAGKAINVMRGLHALGKGLLADGGGRCGTCKHRLLRKCNRFPSWVHGTGVRMYWPACVEFDAIPQPPKKPRKKKGAAE